MINCMCWDNHVEIVSKKWLLKLQPFLLMLQVIYNSLRNSDSNWCYPSLKLNSRKGVSPTTVPIFVTIYVLRQKEPII